MKSELPCGCTGPKCRLEGTGLAHGGTPIFDRKTAHYYARQSTHAGVPHKIARVVRHDPMCLYRSAEAAAASGLPPARCTCKTGQRNETRGYVLQLAH